jgi:hypothetical protein
MTKNTELFTNAVNAAMEAMKKDASLFAQFKAHPLQVRAEQT